MRSKAQVSSQPSEQSDTTDVWGVIRGGAYRSALSKPYSGTDLSKAQADLCLYSMTFNNDADADMATLEAYHRDFRPRARAAGKRHFLEVFNPNIATGFTAAEAGMFVNDCIVQLHLRALQLMSALSFSK